MGMKEKLAPVADIRTVKVDTPEWASAGVPTVWVRTIRAIERSQVQALYGAVAEAARTQTGNDPLTTSRLAAFAIIEEDGNRPFNPDSPDDVAFLAGRDGAVIDRIVLAWLELNGMAPGQDAEKKS